MRPVLVIIAVIAVFVGTAAVGGLYLISTQVPKALIAEELRAWTGGEVQLRGTPTATVRPSPGFVVKDIVVDWPGNTGRGGGRQLAIEEITASLRILPLLAGRFEVGPLTLHKPHLALAADRRAKGPAHAVQQAFMPRAGKTGTIVLRDGSISLDTPMREALAVSGVNLRLTSATDAAPMTVSGQFDLDDWTVYLDGAIAAPGSLFTAQGSEGYLKIAAGYRTSAVALTDNKASSGKDEYGSFAETTRRVAEQTGLARILPRSIGPMRVEGVFSVNDKRLKLAGARFDFRNMHADGNLTLALDNGQALLHDIMTMDRRALGAGPSFLDDLSLEKIVALPVSLGWLQDIDLAFDGSTDAFQIGGVGIEHSLLSLNTEGGSIRIGLKAIGSEDGRGQAALVLRPAGKSHEPGVAVELTGDFTDASLDAAAAAIWARRSNPMIGTERPPTGTADGELRLSATGKTLGALLNSLSGTARFDVGDGSVDGADIVATLEGLRKGGHVMSADDGAFIPIAGRTYFDRLQAGIDFGEGLAHSDGIRIVGDAYEIQLSGYLNLGGGELSGGGIVSLLGTDEAEDASRRLVDLPFGLGGVLRAPVLAPGVPTVIQAAESRRTTSPPGPPMRGNASRGGAS